MYYRHLRFPEGKTKAVTFSYDDGVKADIRLANTLTRYGLKATFNLNSFNLNSESNLSVEECTLVYITYGGTALSLIVKTTGIF